MCSGYSPPANFRDGFDRSSLQLSAFAGGDGDRVYVAVGKSVEKAVSLLQWTVGRFKDQEICILHVHQPSPLIPTLLGKLPAKQANGDVVCAYRRLERDQLKKVLLGYLSICSRLKVKARIVTSESDQVRKRIVDLVNEHGIKKLVMGAVPENWIKVKKSSSKASYTAKNAPSFCQMWFINKGKLLWTRGASESSNYLPTIRQQDSCTLRSHSARFSAGTTNWVQTEAVYGEADLSLTFPSLTSGGDLHTFSILSRPSITGSTYGYFSPAEQRVSLDSDNEESLYGQLAEVKIEAETSRKNAFAELLKRKKLEAQALEVVSKVRTYESAYAHEVELRKVAEDELRTTIKEQEHLLEEREATTKELHKALRNIALLDSRSQEANRRQEEAAEELRLIETSIGTLKLEKQKIQRQKMEATLWLERWKSHGPAAGTSSNRPTGFTNYATKLAEFSLSDLQTATCNFSDSFKIGQGGYGEVYKGELLDRTVAIKKLHSNNMQGLSEFQQEVQVLGKLQHCYLVTLIGICPEACALVYEYMPNGSLQSRISRKSNLYSLNWKIRSRIVAEIASALLFLHTLKPEKIIHGNLKPENILLGFELSCKICDFGISRLVPEETLHCPSFRQYTEPKGAFSYTDPEFSRTGILTPKSDIYSFGLIILQLLTGRNTTGLAIEVRKAVSSVDFVSILDSSAGDWPTFVARRLVDLGLQCCELNSRDRPVLTATLVRELEQLHRLEERAVPSFFMCPILQEIMHDPQLAADGFTYEGEALRGWLKNGGETSPMTNLKLSHLHLTPNHSLRLAIQDWLCNS